MSFLWDSAGLQIANTQQSAPGSRSRGSARSPERTSGPLVSSMMATQPRPSVLYSFTRSTTCETVPEGCGFVMRYSEEMILRQRFSVLCSFPRSTTCGSAKSYERAVTHPSCVGSAAFACGGKGN